MGQNLSIDKHVSGLNELLDMSAQYFQKVKFESKISSQIDQHIKIWQFSEEYSKFDAVSVSPVVISEVASGQFQFSASKSYLCLYIYRGNTSQDSNNGETTSNNQILPPNIIQAIRQAQTVLTPESLARFVARSQDSLSLNSSPSENADQNSTKNDYKHITYVWDGQQASKLVKATAFTKSIELDSLLKRAGDPAAKVLFSGGVIRGQKLLRGSVYILKDLLGNNNSGNTASIMTSTTSGSNQQKDSAAAISEVQLLKHLKKAECAEGSPQQLALDSFPLSSLQSSTSQSVSASQSGISQNSAKNGNYWKRFSRSSTQANSQQTQKPTLALKKPVIPAFKTNVASLGLTELQQDDDSKNQQEEEVQKTQEQKKLVQQSESQKEVLKPGPPFGMGKLNLGGIPPRFEEENQADKTQTTSNNADTREKEVPKMGGGAPLLKGIPSLNVGIIPKTNNAQQESSNSQPPLQQQSSEGSRSGPPKMGLGLGLDLSKAKEIQQQKLAMAEEKKSHARQTAEIARANPPNSLGLNLGAIPTNASKPQLTASRQGNSSGTPDNLAENNNANSGRGENSSDNAEFATPSSQGQGESYRDSAASGRGGGLANSSQNANQNPQTSTNSAGAPPLSMPNLASLNQKVAAMGNQANQSDLAVSGGIGGIGALNKPAFSSKAAGIENMQIAPEQLNDEDFDYNGTSRKEYENEFYKRICSEIIPGFLFLGSDLVAKDSESFEKNGITHVVNCAADYSQDYHIDKGVKYKSYHLKDHVREDISCVFYDAIDFMQKARDAGGKVYVHCVQGISRSSTIIIAYKIFTEGVTYQEAYEQVKARRACANPNMTFIAQLVQFQKRLQNPQFSSISVNPRVFVLSSHQAEDPHRISCKLLMEKLYQPHLTKRLDSRGVFIVHAENAVYIWRGKDLMPQNGEAYMRAAEDWVSLLQQHERASRSVNHVTQGEEGDQFWQALNIEGPLPPPNAYEPIPDWTRLYIDLATAKKSEGVRNTVVGQMDEYQDQVREEKALKPKLYNYPDFDNPIAVFDFEELENEDALLVLCVRKDPENEDRIENQAFQWTGPTFELQEHPEADSMNEKQFLQKCIDHYWGPDSANENVQVRIEEPHDPSDNFMDFFD